LDLKPLGPGSVVGDELLQTLQEIAAAITELEAPTRPVQMPAVLNADLPPAENWPGCYIFVTDEDCIAISTDVAGTYTWLRADGSAI
jgi:hypothetical protein